MMGIMFVSYNIIIPAYNLDTNDVPVSFQMVPLSVFDAFCQMSSVTAFGLN